jgi:O-antigen/teichoic acid export membrane protein
MLVKLIARDSAIYGSADFITKFISFFSFPILAAYISPRDFGILELILTIISIAVIVLSAGLNNAVHRFYWDKKTNDDSRSSIVSTGFLFLFFGGVFTIILGLILLPYAISKVRQMAWSLSYLGLLATLAMMATKPCSGYILDVTRVQCAPWRFMVFALSTRVLAVCLALFAVVIGNLGLNGWLVANALVLTMTIPLGLYLIKKDIKINLCNFYWVKKLLSFGHPFIYAGLIYWLLGSMDRWMLASMTSLEEVGVYSVAFRFASIVMLFSAAFGQAWSPLAIKIRTKYPNDYRNIYGQMLLLLFFTMLLIGGGLALFAGESIFLLMPANYLPSALPLIILCFGIVLKSTQQITAIGISLEKKTLLFTPIALLTAVVNLIGNYFLIPIFGATGAAITTFISFLTLTTCYLYFTQKIHPINVPWRNLSITGFLSIVVGFLSIFFLRFSLEIEIVTFKLLVLSFCFIFGWRFLAFNLLKNVKM